MTAGLIGVAVEYLIVRRFYKRPLDSLLATWGLSLIVTQSMLLIVGSSITGIGTPEGSFAIGDYTFSTYRLVLFACAVAVLIGLYVTFMKTRFGLMARATMQNAAMAKALGARTGRIYAISFGIGAGLAGLCGALYAPTMTLIPTMGATFVVESFVTVVVGGANVLLGTAPAARVPGDDPNGPECELRADHRPDRHAVCRHPDHSCLARRPFQCVGPSCALSGRPDVETA